MLKVSNRLFPSVVLLLIYSVDSWTGILTLIEQCAAKNVVLVHGEAAKMDTLKSQIEKRFKIGCQCPANGQTITIKTAKNLSIQVPRDMLKRALKDQESDDEKDDEKEQDSKKPKLKGTVVIEDGVMVLQDDAS